MRGFACLLLVIESGALSLSTNSAPSRVCPAARAALSPLPPAVLLPRLRPARVLAPPMACMKRADLPSEEEISAVQWLGGAGGGLVWSKLFGGSLLFGVLAGVLAARAVAHSHSKAGTYLREAGWLAYERYRVARRLAVDAWGWAGSEARQVGVPPPRELQRMAVELLRRAALDARSRASERLLERLAPVRQRLAAVSARGLELWRASPLPAAWQQSGVPDSVRRFRQRVHERREEEVRRQSSGGF
ncbi:hypothetical protein EMIHUDRAFT_227489 [Emiliania huxleyi CCMP1516]|uniref:Uncharacterized protein n=2 Tax=Emiliania huxleyi TaxID=2903 RepID=A0A0D3KIV5_EMIH1|nr:hypothetical protein EMIHUDRAFT_227489 [Emiliania huxleyi CCMP1516]EOD35690.1 hypothetical protein EMIHUDRAFT_227489 [Emiliania huxleyi CCMP1516]|eukprot:XP_005788119.1 hypothetical protein EMIHUDRAFT_227489 [Emiliania huxleyi CCMP1516]